MKPNRTSLSISVRRHFVDRFFFAHSSLIGSGSRVIDIGGKKENKRGLFDVNRFSTNITYVNIEKKDNPDIVADAKNIPVNDNFYDIAIAAELLEHVPDPKEVLKEIHRILKKNGIALITVPFMYPIHADPHDYGRYTENYWQNVIKEIGFSEINTKRQGGIFSIGALMIQHIFRAKKKSWEPIQTLLVRFFMWLDNRSTSPILRAWTSGYGIVLKK